MPDMPIGELIRLHRIDRKKSTTSVATHAGITVRYLEMIEAGTKTPTIYVLRKIARVLGVRTSALLGEAPSENDEGEVNPRLAKVERALFTYQSVPLETAVSQEDLPARIHALGDIWYRAEDGFDEVLAVLPGLIVETERAVCESDHSPESCRTAYYLYRLLRSVLKHSGRIGLCPLVADRAMRYAEQSEDPTTLHAACWNLGMTMLSGDMPAGALDVAMPSAERMESLLPDGTSEQLSVYGALIHVGAIASARTGDPWRGRELLRDKAMPVAERVGELQSHHHICFGPTNVRIHAVCLELEDGDVMEALRIADAVDLTKIESMERKSAHLYYLARAYEYRGNDAAVLVHLQMAEKFRAQDFRYKSEIRTMVRTLARRAKPSYASEVKALATRIGLLDV